MFLDRGWYGDDSENVKRKRVQTRETDFIQVAILELNRMFRRELLGFRILLILRGGGTRT